MPYPVPTLTSHSPPCTLLTKKNQARCEPVSATLLPILPHGDLDIRTQAIDEMWPFRNFEKE